MLPFTPHSAPATHREPDGFINLNLNCFRMPRRWNGDARNGLMFDRSRISMTTNALRLQQRNTPRSQLSPPLLCASSVLEHPLIFSDAPMRRLWMKSDTLRGPCRSQLPCRLLESGWWYPGLFLAQS